MEAEVADAAVVVVVGGGGGRSRSGVSLTVLSRALNMSLPVVVLRGDVVELALVGGVGNFRPVPRYFRPGGPVSVDDDSTSPPSETGMNLF